jgi:glycosyltransferase involved in cell wall biosynthesis
VKVLIQDNYFFNWQGGANYIRNLTKALRLNGVEVNQVAFSIEELHSDNIYDHRFLFKYSKRFSLNWFLGKLKLRDHFASANQWISNQEVCFQVHQGYINSNLPTVRWIPDFQHLELPEYFSEEEIAKRESDFKWIAEESDKVILSSHHAASVFKTNYPEYADKSAVLQFTVDIPVDQITTDRSQIAQKYNLPERYIHFPGQWWKHKNHEMIVEVLNGKSIPVVFTGSTDDYRHPDYFKSLKARINELEEKGLIRVLGNIPYADMLSVMYHAEVVINPSKYEGWSTTIEEAKMMGKWIYASDIVVNQEQLNSYGKCKILGVNQKSDWHEVFQSLKKTAVYDSLADIDYRRKEKLNKFGFEAVSIFSALKSE